MVDPLKRQYQKADPHKLFISKTPRMVDKKEKLLQGASGAPHRACSFIDGKGLGSSLRHSPSGRSLEQAPGKEPYQLARAKSCPSSACSASTSDQRGKNSIVVAYVIKEGGTKSLHLCQLTWEVSQWAADYIFLCTAIIPGKKNVFAEYLLISQVGAQLTQ